MARTRRLLAFKTLRPLIIIGVLCFHHELRSCSSFVSLRTAWPLRKLSNGGVFVVGRVDWFLSTQGSSSSALHSHSQSSSKEDIRQCDSTADSDADQDGITRRAFLAWNTASAVTLGSLYDPAIASALTNQAKPSTTVPRDSSINGELSNSIPYSSLRQYKAIQLSNGLEVLLVNDQRMRSLASAALTIRGAGQFSDPVDGLAHLMEHMILSSPVRGSNMRRERPSSRVQDFEDWLVDYDGASNGFTAYEKVCFHFTSPAEVLSEALDRFASLFLQNSVEETCRSKETIRREIRRVNSELDFRTAASQELYLLKSLLNPEHPFSRLSAGNLTTLETVPVRKGVDISKKLIEFFHENYLPSRAVLVITAPFDFHTLESWVSPFASTLSKLELSEQRILESAPRIFPPPFTENRHISPICIFRKKNEVPLDERVERIIFHWPLDMDYGDIKSSNRNVVTASQVAFCLSQIFGRRGPGTLYQLLKSRGWIPDGSQGVPRFSFTVDASGFQILKLELHVTIEGFLSRAAIVAAVYDTINSLRSGQATTGALFVLKRELVTQYASIAELYGYRLAPRPSDAIELAFDAQMYGLKGSKGVSTAEWNRFPSPTDLWGIVSLQRQLAQTLQFMSDPANTILFATASKRAILAAKTNLFDNSLPKMSPASWDVDPLTGARYFRDDMFRATGKASEWIAKRLMDDELSAPSLNPLVPPYIRLARISPEVSVQPPPLLLAQQPSISSVPESRASLLTSMFPPVAIDSTSNANDAMPEIERALNDPSQSSIVRDSWRILKVVGFDPMSPRLRLPPLAPEPSCRSVFILQLLSCRPARANVEMAAHAELWKTSFEYVANDLGEFGIPGALAYEISFNKFGMRISFVGISQNIASYARRVARRLVDHPRRLAEKQAQFPPEVVEMAVRRANRGVGISQNRKRLIVNLLRDTTPADAEKEATAFFQSCSGGVCISQGDLLPRETAALLGDLKIILRTVTGSNVTPIPATPEVQDILYAATWMPRSGSLCSIPGASHISDACGRVPR